jgi:hypothetical protein
VWSEIQVVLARLGDLTRLSELDPMPVARKLTSLKKLLENGAGARA